MSNDYVCRECGEPGDADKYLEHVSQRLLTVELCHSCDFWSKLLRWNKAGDVTEKGHPVARIGGVHYVLQPFQANPQHASCLGFGGRKMTVVFNDGREVTSNDVWYQGKIPERFRDRLPDNATWAGVA